MNNNFALIINNLPIFTQFCPIDNNKFINQVDFSSFSSNNTRIQDLCFCMLSQCLSLNQSAILYYTTNQYNLTEGWEYIGGVSLQNPSFFYSFPSNSFQNNPGLTFGISIEPLEFLSNLEEKHQQSYHPLNLAERIVNNFYNYLSSFNINTSSYPMIPMSAIDQWYQKFLNKLSTDPTFYLQ